MQKSIIIISYCKKGFKICGRPYINRRKEKTKRFHLYKIVTSLQPCHCMGYHYPKHHYDRHHYYHHHPCHYPYYYYYYHVACYGATRYCNITMIQRPNCFVYMPMRKTCQVLVRIPGLNYCPCFLRICKNNTRITFTEDGKLQLFFKLVESR